MGKIIEVKNLFKLYRVGDSVVHALNGVNFSINEGEFCAIVGTSGSGKSTLLNMLAGLEKPTKGEVIINGEHMEKLKEDQLVSFRRDHVGFIFQSFHLIGTMNAVENVALPLSFRGEKKESRLKKADKMLDLVNLKKHKKHLPNQMSGEAAAKETMRLPKHADDLRNSRLRRKRRRSLIHFFRKLRLRRSRKRRLALSMIFLAAVLYLPSGTRIQPDQIHLREDRKSVV